MDSEYSCNSLRVRWHLESFAYPYRRWQCQQHRNCSKGGDHFQFLQSKLHWWNQSSIIPLDHLSELAGQDNQAI